MLSVPSTAITPVPATATSAPISTISTRRPTHRPTAADTDVAGSRSYEIRGGASQLLPCGLRARGKRELFLQHRHVAGVQHQYLRCVPEQPFVRRQHRRRVGQIHAQCDHRSQRVLLELTDSYLAGNLPRVSFSRNERPILDSPVYFSVSGEYLNSIRATNAGTDTAGRPCNTVDTGLSRVDVVPQIRYPFKKWQWFTVNSTVSWRDTYYTRSFEPTGDPSRADQDRRHRIEPQAVHGPGADRRPRVQQGLGHAAERLRREVQALDRAGHDHQPHLVGRQFQRDRQAGRHRQLHRRHDADLRPQQPLLRQAEAHPGRPAQSREIFDVELSQSYYTNQGASQYDLQYQTHHGQLAPTHFSPIALSFRACRPTT